MKPIRYPEISITIYADALLEGCGVSMGNVSTGRAWLPGKKLMHINILELKAFLPDIKSIVKKSHKNIKIMFDNTAAIHSISKRGISFSMECNHQVLKIWGWASI